MKVISHRGKFPVWKHEARRVDLKELDADDAIILGGVLVFGIYERNGACISKQKWCGFIKCSQKC